MIKLIFIIFILLLLFYLLRPFFHMAFSVRKMQQQYSEMWRKVQEEAQRTTQNQGRRKTPRKKVFDSSEGEYVEFEEVTEERVTVVDDGDNEYTSYDRITDVKYEEIKD